MRLAPGLLVLLASSSALAERARPPVASQPGPPPPTAGAPLYTPVPAVPAVVAPMPPPKPVPAPKPAPLPPELAALARTLGGTWACKGNEKHPDGSSSPMTAKITIKADLGGRWIAAAYAEKSSTNLTGISYRTFNADTKQWKEIQLGSDGSSLVSTSGGEANGEWVWTADGGIRTHEQITAKTLKVWSESMVAGAWAKQSELNCAK